MLSKALVSLAVSAVCLVSATEERARALHPRLASDADIKKPTPLYKNPNASIEDRVNDLLPRMTVDEKVAQMYVEL